MFIYESTNYESLEKDSITGKNVIECCAKVLNYNNQKIIDIDDIKEYTVKFLDKEGSIMCEISENGLVFAINGEIDNETDKIKDESQKFWELSHKNVISIEFSNPVRSGDAIWDEEYVEQEDASDDEDDESDDGEEINHNINA